MAVIARIAPLTMAVQARWWLWKVSCYQEL
jgi:hypothetical protein